MALVAQRIEQLRPKQTVGGSIPFEGTEYTYRLITTFTNDLL